MRKHWETTSTEKLFSTPRLEVHRDQVINPGGQAHPYDHVVLADTVRAVVLNDDGQVLVVDQEHYLPKQRLFQLPGGALDPEEDPQQGAARELAEETGIHGGQWTGLGSWWPLPAMTSCRAHAFLVTGWQTGVPAREASEADMELVWMPVEKATAQVECAVSMAALTRADAVAEAEPAGLPARFVGGPRDGRTERVKLTADGLPPREIRTVQGPFGPPAVYRLDGTVMSWTDTGKRVYVHVG